MQLNTERLSLRDWKRSDWKEAHEYASDPEVVRYLDWGPNHIDDTVQFVDVCLDSQRQKPRSVFELAIIHCASGKLIGGCGLRQLAHDRRQADVGYCLNRSYWRRGYATEVCRRLIEFGFQELKLHRIYAICDAENYGSSGVLKSSGMRQEGHFVQDRSVKGHWRDTLLFAVLNEEWSRNKDTD